jgi:hypothetical protein
MTLEDKLSALLLAICPRSFPDFARANTPRPYVTWQQFGGEALDFIGTDVPNKENATIQINVWSDTRAEAKSIIKQIEVAMIGSIEFQASAISAAASDFDADMEVRSSRQDFSVWADR